MTVELYNLRKIAKPYKLDKTFVLLADSPGWSDTFFADLTDKNVEVMKAKAFMVKDKLHNYTISEGRPNIKGLVWDGDGLSVDKIGYDLTHDAAILISGDLSIAVNPVYIRYFLDTYKMLETYTVELNFKVIEERQPVKVFSGDDLIGVIMPIRLDV